MKLKYPFIHHPPLNRHGCFHWCTCEFKPCGFEGGSREGSVPPEDTWGLLEKRGHLEILIKQPWYCSSSNRGRCCASLCNSTGTVSGHGDPTETQVTELLRYQCICSGTSTSAQQTRAAALPCTIQGNKMHPAGNYSHMKQCAKDQAVRELSGGVADFPVAIRDNRSKREFSSREFKHCLQCPRTPCWLVNCSHCKKGQWWVDGWTWWS